MYYLFRCFNKECPSNKNKDLDGKYGVPLDFYGEQDMFFIPEEEEWPPCTHCSGTDVKFSGKGNLSRANKVTKAGYDDKGFQKEWYKEEIKNTEKALDERQGVSPYSKYKINYEKLAEQGRLKKVKGNQAVKNREKSSKMVASTAAKNLREDEYKNVGHRPNG